MHIKEVHNSQYGNCLKTVWKNECFTLICIIFCENNPLCESVDFTEFLGENHESLRFTNCGNYRNILSNFLGKNFVKATVLLKKLLNSWFDEKNFVCYTNFFSSIQSIYISSKEINLTEFLWLNSGIALQYIVKFCNFQSTNRENNIIQCCIVAQIALISRNLCEIKKNEESTFP